MELRPLFQYIKTESVNPDDSFVSMIYQRVLKYQNDEEVAYNMTLEEDFLRERVKAERKGREIGMAEGRVEMQDRINKLGLQLKSRTFGRPVPLYGRCGLPAEATGRTGNLTV